MKFVEEFKKFALRGNIMDLAIGFTVGAAFTTVARSLVDDLIMPVVGLITGGAEFQDLFLVLREGAAGGPYRTLAEAQAAGAVTFNYGLFINSVLVFLIVALVMFAIIRLIARLDAELEEEAAQQKAGPEEPANKKCPYCLSTIAYKATRCPNCTSSLDTVTGYTEVHGETRRTTEVESLT